MSAQHDITAAALIAEGRRPIHAGDHYNHKFTLTEDGEVFNLTGCKVWLTVKRNYGDSDSAALLQLSSAVVEEIEITQPTQGELYVFFTPAKTQRLAGTWKYDIQVLKADGKVWTWGRGIIEFLPNVTRDID